MKIEKTLFPLMIVLDAYRDGDYGHVDGFVLQRNPAKENSLESLPYMHGYEGLALSSQCGKGDSGLYAWEVKYGRYGNGLTMRELERATAIMRPIARKLEKMTELEGEPKTYGQFVNRIARAIGAESVMIRDKAHPRTHGPRICALGDSVSTIDWHVAELVKVLNPQAVAA